MTYYEKLNKYIEDISKGRILSGIYTKKAIQRFKSDLTKSKQPSYLYEFKPELAEQMIGFAECLYIPDISKNLELLPWMLFLFYNLYGWVLKADNTVRRFRRGYVEVARKNSKTTSILNPLILYDFLTTDSAESYLVSKDEGLSEKSYQELKQIILNTPALKECGFNMTTKAITYKSSRISYFEEKSTGVDGYRNSLSIIDEYHAYDTDRIVTSFQYGGRARKNSLTLMITSAGNDISRPCYSENLTCKKILNGLLTDEQYFGIIYAIDEEDKWDDESIYIKANPSLGIVTKPEALHSDLIDAQIKPHHKPDFISKTLGRWSFGKSTWIPIDKVEQNQNVKETFEDIAADKKINVYGGLDIASVNDLCVFTMCCEKENRFYFHHKYFIPEATIEKRYTKENSDFLKWISDGLIYVIPGETNDYNFVSDYIIKCADKYNLLQVGYDKWQSNDIIKTVDEERNNIQLVEVEQNLKKFAPLTKEYEKAMYDGVIVDNNPVHKWCLGNVIIQPDVNNNYKPMKESKASTARIDSVITAIMSFNLCKIDDKPVISRSFADVLAMI